MNKIAILNLKSLFGLFAVKKKSSGRFRPEQSYQKSSGKDYF